MTTLISSKVQMLCENKKRYVLSLLTVLVQAQFVHLTPVEL